MMKFKLTFVLPISVLLLSLCVPNLSVHGQAFQTDWSFSDEQYKSLKLGKNLEIKLGRWQRYLKFEGDKTNEFYAPTRTYGIFRDTKDEKSFYVLGQQSADNHGMALHHYAAPTYMPKLLIQTHERQRPSGLSFHQTADGNIFVISKQGLLLCFRDGKFVDRYALDGYYQNPTKMFQTIEGFVAEDQRVVFFSRVPADFEGKALRDLIVYKDGEFKKIDLKGKSLGAIQVTIGDELHFLTSEGIQVVNTKTGDIKRKPIPTPTENGKPLFPVGFFVTQSGQMVSVWRKSKVKGSSYEFETFNDGFYTKVAELKSGKWEFTSIGLDDKQVRWKPRFAEDSSGRCWITGSKNDRMLVRHPDGKYQLVDTMRKLNRFWISKMTFDDEDNIVIHSSSFSGTESFSIPELLAKKAPEYSYWKKVLSRTPLIPNSKNSLYGISSKQGGKLMKITDREFEYFDLPDQKEFNALNSVYLTADTEDNVWLFSDKQNRVAVFEDKKWTVFKSETRDGKEWSGKMVALVDRAQKLNGNLDYKIGMVGEIRVSFGPNEQIAFNNDKYRVSYFDGESWHDPKAGYEIGRSRPFGRPFFENGEVRFIDYKLQCYGMTREQFRSMKNVTHERKWKSVNAEDSKEYGSRKEEMLARKWTPRSKPPVSGRAYKRGSAWAAINGNDCALTLNGQTWSEFSLSQTPLKNATSFALYDSLPNTFVFIADNDRFVYYPPKVEVKVPEASMGDFDKPGLTSLLKFETEPPDQKVHLRYRIAGDPWSKWQTPDKPVLLRGVARKGKHSLDVEFNFDKHLSRSQKKTYQFTTTYSMQEKIDNQVALLGASTFAERESAMKKLIDFGPAVLPTINALSDSPDAETRTRAKRISEAIKTKLEQ